MEQITMTYGAEVAGAADWSDQLAWLRKAVDVIGHKELAYKLDIAPSQLTDALLEQKRKDIKAKWVATIVRLAPHEMRDEWMWINIEMFGYEVFKRCCVLILLEELKALRAAVEEKAPGLLLVIDKELGR